MSVGSFGISEGNITGKNFWLPEQHGTGKSIKHTAHLGLCPYRALKSLRGLDLGSAWNTGPTWDSAIAKHPGAWAVWTWEVYVVLPCGKPHVVHRLCALPTHARDIFFFLQCPSLSTAQLNEWTWINGHFCPLVSGRKLDTEETCKQRKPK